MAQNFKKQTNQKNKKKDSHNPAKSNHDAFSTERVLRGESQLNLFRYLQFDLRMCVALPLANKGGSIFQNKRA